MSDTKEELLAEIEAFLARTGMGPTQFGKLIDNNTNVVKRLRAGKSITTDTADKIRDFIRNYESSDCPRRRGHGRRVPEAA